MKIAIAGAGVSGSHLTHSLSGDHEVEVFDRREAEDLGQNCAWGTSMRTLRKYSSRIGKDPSDYLRHVSENFISDVFVNRDTVTFDKNKFLRDFLEKSGAKVNYSSDIEEADFDSYDLIIDATGTKRELLPAPSNDLESSWIAPCFQAVVKSEELPKDLYFDMKETWYLWSFPQGKDKHRVGCASFELNPREEVEEFLSGKHHETIEEAGASIRGVPPEKSLPFFVEKDPPVIGVGECIGTVSPFSGEGITFSLICSSNPWKVEKT